ncbi:MAG: precorrin-6y C5,15-methyltransferase (decarboxylating) subunit CbiE [Synergistes jonesii]|uniref:precorrin-6y C5,15-methyltransferase (decarboxylating) subunit CbiE n=1 Tax=Synergistes jonesii TaxID=2754 RepID=UPI002A752E66|nr:precorrin-6y C5,15-methyltransferase (decarboxylating) subunit CbiE [Synergistes jonesii]MDY2984431.1 precorrin-6y C5,15-methyltransferase (decarboxylating) subunit CbiE [Synergistes jonesii]
MKNKLYVLSAGPGNAAELTPAVREAIAASRAVAAAPRHHHLAAGHPNVLEMRDFKETFERLREELKAGDVSLLVSGDAGIFSLLPLIKKNFPDEDIVVLPGVSSLQSLCAKAGETWQDAVILSGHGRDIPDEKILDAAEHNRSVIFFCDAKKNPAWLCALLDGSGLGGVSAVVGERLGSEEERVRRGAARELAKESFDSLAIALLINDEFSERAPLLPEDSDFIRTEGIPMTHEDVRAVIIAKLRLTPETVLWDVGAGTGSVSIAAAQLCRRVHAVEVNAEAAELVRENAKKFRLHNVKVYESSALAKLAELPKPDAVFIGGSGPELPAILDCVSERGSGIRVVVSAVSLKTSALCTMKLSGNRFAAFDAAQIAVSRIKRVGNAQIWQARNPVTIFSALTRG